MASLVKVTNNVTGLNWNDLVNIQTENDDYGFSDSIFGFTDYITCGFDLSELPTNLQVNGLEMEYSHYGAGSTTCAADTLQFLDNDVPVGEDKGNFVIKWANGWNIETFGAADDLWEYAWTREKLVHANFGFYFRGHRTVNGTIAIRYIKLTVHYTELAAPTSPVQVGRPFSRLLSASPQLTVGRT